MSPTCSPISPPQKPIRNGFLPFLSTGAVVRGHLPSRPPQATPLHAGDQPSHHRCPPRVALPLPCGTPTKMGFTHLCPVAQPYAATQATAPPPLHTGDNLYQTRPPRTSISLSVAHCHSHAHGNSLSSSLQTKKKRRRNKIEIRKYI